MYRTTRRCPECGGEWRDPCCLTCNGEGWVVVWHAADPRKPTELPTSRERGEET